MAGRAILLLDRRVLDEGFLLAPDRVGVAGAAEPPGRLPEERLPGRGVGAVAVPAADLVQDGPVDAVSGQGLVDHGAMAPPAKLEPRLFRGQGVGRRGLRMALVAHLVDDRRMDGGPQDAGIVRAVRVVARGAARLRHRVVHVLLPEGRLVGPVAVVAQSRDRLLEQERRLPGRMRIVAAETVARDRGVPELDLRDGLRHLRVTAGAELVAGGDQVGLVLRGVRIVAADALARHDRRMDALRLVRDQPGVAARADRRGVRGEELAMGRGVGIVAVGAVARFHGRMDEGPAQGVLEGRMA